MTLLDLTFVMVLSFGIAWVMLIGTATLARPVFLRSPMFIGNRRISTALDLGHGVLFTLPGTITASFVLAFAVIAAAAAIEVLA